MNEQVEITLNDKKCLQKEKNVYVFIMIDLKNYGFGDEIDGEKTHHQIIRFGDVYKLKDYLRLLQECFYFLMPYQKC